MAKKYSKKVKSKTKFKVEKKEKKSVARASSSLKRQKKTKKEDNHHKFLLHDVLKFEDILSKVIPIKGGKYGVLSESGEFVIFSINTKKEIKCELSFNVIGANSFCQLGNGLFVFNSFNYVSFWELKGTKLNKLAEYQTICGLVVYSMEPIDDKYCAISGPSDTIEIVRFTKAKKLPVIFLNYQKFKSKRKKDKKKLIDSFPEGIGCLYYQKKTKKLLATHFSNILRVWNCDFKKNNFELFKEVEYVSNFAGKIIQEMKDKILIGGKDVITILNNNTYDITDFIDLGNFGYDIFSMEIINYYDFKEFVVCGLRNGKILGVDIVNKKIEFSKQKINNTGKDNEMNVKDGKLSFYGENVCSISKVDNKNMILVASHDHTLKLIEY